MTSVLSHEAMGFAEGKSQIKGQGARTSAGRITAPLSGGEGRVQRSANLARQVMVPSELTHRVYHSLQLYWRHHRPP